MRDPQFLFTDYDNVNQNWHYQDFYLKYAGANFRYHTFQLAMNWLNQLVKDPVIIETGCQRFKDDIGSGMSTTIFARYIERFGGHLISVDNNAEHVALAREVLSDFHGIDVNVYHEDSLKYLQRYEGPCDLLYLDSYDYPLNPEGRVNNIPEMNNSQQHNLTEFKLMELKLKKHTLLLLDDNQLDRGGKTKLTKAYLSTKPEWVLLLDFQQSLWLKVGK